MTIKELLDNWASESNAANDCIIEILESYMEFLDWVIGYVDHGCNVPGYKVKWFAEKRKTDWMSILEHAKKAKEKANCAG